MNMLTRIHEEQARTEANRAAEADRTAEVEAALAAEASAEAAPKRGWKRLALYAAPVVLLGAA